MTKLQFLLFLFVFTSIVSYSADNKLVNAKDSQGISEVNTKNTEGLTFIINNSITDLNEFKQLVQAASRLKKYGDVQINIGVVADKAFYEVPEGGNPWSEYASNFANVYKFYPDEIIAPFIPENLFATTQNCFWPKQRFCAKMEWMQLFQ
ncbi:MAG: hypothetical protein IPF54_01545 [Draconibacterium sp.]|nr:hypothetical protein [Draconibacterium sp.]